MWELSLLQDTMKVSQSLRVGNMSTFTERVKEVVKAIPKGSTLTYKEVAVRAGSPGASRAVGSIMKANYDLKIPCHRVVKSDGTVGEYNRGGSAKKAEILEQEKSQ